MVFNSPAYLFLFFPPVWLASRLFHKRGRKLWFCAVTLLFYAFGKPRDILILLGFTLLHRGLGQRLKGRKGLLLLGLTLDVGMLCAFKFFGSAPLGVSFFTFQGIAYLVDVFREPERASADPIEVFLYLCFFPRLLSGPLMGWDEHHRQYVRLRPRTTDAAEGLRRFVLGLGKKLLLSDLIGTIADSVFAAEASALSSAAAWLGAIAYSLQLYFDFSAYSDMAIGMGLCFGFRFPENFDRPFLAKSIGEFWRRWHMTLGNWFKLYVYFPLGGSHKGKGRTALNKLIIFLLTGLWHGFGWTFLLWGLWHGLFAALEALWKNHRKASKYYTLPVVILGFVMFRAETAAQGFALLGRLFSFSGGSFPEVQIANLVALLLGLPLSVVRLPKNIRREVSNTAALLLYVLCLCALAGSSFAPFIYAQF